MNVVLSKPEVADLIRERGGRVFVWTDARRCCSGRITYLLTGTEPVRGRDFRRFDAEGFELWFDAGGATPPDELHLDVRGRRHKRIEAYWNGCVFAI